jgi:hypothetical protein
MGITKITCKNCNNHFTGSYCPECGQKVILERFTIKHLVSIFFDSFNVGKGLIHTFLLLFSKPGQIINDYLKGRTKDYYNPLKYLMLVAGINAVLILWFGVFDNDIANTNELLGKGGEADKLQMLILGYVRSYLSIISIAILPFYSLVSMWIFKKHKLFYAEHLIINGYLFAQYTIIQLLISLFFIYIPGLSEFTLISQLVLFIAYYTYSLRSVFKIKFFKSLYASAAIYFLGLIFFYILIIIISVIAVVLLSSMGSDLKELLQ